MENLTLTLSSGRTAELREITAREQMNADACSEGEPVKLGYYRVAMSLAKLGDEDLPRSSSKVALDSIIDRLTGREIDELGAVLQVKFGPDPGVLKKALSPPSSD